MNKSDFLQNLDQLLAELPPDIRKGITDYYDEILTTAITGGRLEKEVVAELGLPKTIANYHITEYFLEAAEQNLTTYNFFKVIRSALRLGIANLVWLIIPLLGTLGVLIALGGTSLVVVILGIALLAGIFIDSFTIFTITMPAFFYENAITSLGTFFLSIGLAAFGFLFAQNRMMDYIFPHINFKKAVGILTLLIFVCFTLTILTFVFGGDSWFSG